MPRCLALPRLPSWFCGGGGERPTEAARKVPTRKVLVRPPLEDTEGEELSTDVVAVKVLCAGLGILQVFTRQLANV